MSEDRYIRYQKEKLIEYENLCKRCGACCGVFDNDPCINLKEEVKGKYFCAIYENKLGVQNSISGKEFICVPIWDILHKSWSGSFNCAYKKTILSWVYR
jgi:hypothetical protein